MTTSNEGRLPDKERAMEEEKPSASLFGRAFSAVEEVASLYCGAALIAVMVAFIAVEVISRLSVNYSFIGIVDIVSLCLVVITCITLSGVQREDAHIKMDLVAVKLSGRRAGYVLQFIILLLAMVTMGIFCYMMAKEALILYRTHDFTITINWPVWPFAMIIPLGLLLLIIRLGIQIKQSLTGILQR